MTPSADGCQKGLATPCTVSGWDGNVVLHEWDTDEALRPRLVTDETGREEYDGTEKPEGAVDMGV